ncbi:MAG TPA: alpha/beta fold hydrolase, partial [Acidimicrobiia bacterium]|nr:alpha/beta fold hydrolase [Acidimicrobiia bacterium]
DAELDRAVDEFLHLIAAPGRPREPRVAHALADVPLRAVASRHGRLAAWRVGEGPAVLLVHGWQDDSSLWSPLIDALVARGRAVVAFDLPGQGFSEGAWSLGPEVADGVHAVAEQLGPIDAVVTHSMSAGGVVMAVYEGWRVERLVFVAPPIRAGRHERWWRYAQRYAVPDAVVHEAIARFDARLGPERATFDFFAVVRSIDVDVLIVHSRADERNPFQGSADLVPQCRRAELFAVDGLTHRGTARDPAVVARIAEFVASA